MVLKMLKQVNRSFAVNIESSLTPPPSPTEKRKWKTNAKAHNQQLISFTSVWIQWAGGWAVYLTASSNIPSRSNRPGLEHIENPPTTDTPGIKKSTLKIDENQKLKQANKQNQNMENSRQNKIAGFISITQPLQKHLHFHNITFPISRLNLD